MPSVRPILLILLVALALGVLPASAQATPAPVVFVDLDTGVDDAVALAWLLQQRNLTVAGLTTVAGNATVENATRNTLTVLAAANRTVPVTIGAAQPLAGARNRTGAFVHGPDGLWFLQQPQDISGLPTDAPAALAAQARANPQTIFIALGPLTNIAQATQRFPADMAGVRVVALGGGTFGNTTPVAEFNVYADPLALDVVLQSGVRLDLVTIDAFDQVQVDVRRFTQLLERRRDALGALLAPAVQAYAQAQSLDGSLPRDVAIPDAAAVIFALQPSIGAPISALVHVETNWGKAKGQTIIGTTLEQRIPMIASEDELNTLADRAFSDPTFNFAAEIGAILARQPDNANVVLEINGRQAARILERDLRR